MTQESVVLLHGFLSHRVTMWRLAQAFEREGYRVLNLGFPSRRESVEALAEHLLPKLKIRLEGTSGPVHFIGHSLGGRVALALAERPELAPRAGRIVTLGTPYGGQKAAGFFASNARVKNWMGDAGAALAQAMPEHGLPPGAELGVINGQLPWSGLWPSGPTDGVVPLATAVPAQLPHTRITLPVGHMVMPLSDEVIGAASRFVRDGRF
ncbi:MAG: esterase/lipase family protein [Rickettsiales bacterium]